MPKTKILAFVDHNSVPTFFYPFIVSSENAEFVSYRAMLKSKSIEKRMLDLNAFTLYEEFDIYQLPNFLFHLTNVPQWGQTKHHDIDIHWFCDLPEQIFSEMNGPFGLRFRFRHHKVGDRTPKFCLFIAEPQRQERIYYNVVEETQTLIELFFEAFFATDFKDTLFKEQLEKIFRLDWENANNIQIIEKIVSAFRGFAREAFTEMARDSFPDPHKTCHVGPYVCCLNAINLGDYCTWEFRSMFNEIPLSCMYKSIFPPDIIKQLYQFYLAPYAKSLLMIFDEKAHFQEILRISDYVPRLD